MNIDLKFNIGDKAYYQDCRGMIKMGTVIGYEVRVVHHSRNKQHTVQAFYTIEIDSKTTTQFAEHFLYETEKKCIEATSDHVVSKILCEIRQNPDLIKCVVDKLKSQIKE